MLKPTLRIALKVFIFFITTICFTQIAIACEYFLDLTITKELNVSGSTKVSFKNNSQKTLSEIYFALPLNRESKPDAIDKTIYDYSYPKGFETSYTKINKVYQKKHINKYSYLKETIINTLSPEKNYLRVILDKKYLPGETIELNIDFFSQIPNKFANGKHNNIIYLQGFFYPNLLELKENGSFVFNHDRLNTAKYKYKIKTPKKYTLATGSKTKIKRLNNYNEHSGEIENPISLFSLAASSIYKKITYVSKNITIDSFYIKNEKIASNSIKIVIDAINFYKNNYGMNLPTKYIALVENYMGNLSAYTGGNMIFIPSEMRKMPKHLKRLYEVVIVHEVAHLWWGISVSYPFDKDNWIGEGLNTFLMNAYFDLKYGKEHNMLEQENNYGFTNKNYTYEEVSSYLPIRALLLSGRGQKITNNKNFTTDISTLSNLQYNKGLYIFKIINNKIGANNFKKLLSALRNKYKKNPLTTKDLLNEINLISDKDLTTVFDNWVYSNKTFDYKIESVKTCINPSLNYTTIIKIKNKAEIIEPITVELIDQKNNKYYKNSLAKDTSYIEIISSESMKEVNIDPLNIYPDLYKIDNHYPTRIKNSIQLLAPESDAYYFQLAPSYVITNAGNFFAFKGMYGYLDDFRIQMGANPDFDAVNASVLINRWPHQSYSLEASISGYKNLFQNKLNLTKKEYKNLDKYSYLGRLYSISYLTEDLFDIEYSRHNFIFFGLNKTLYTEKQGNAKAISFSINDKTGLTPLSTRQLNYQFDYYRDFLGSEYNFEQSKIYFLQNIRTSHLQSISIESSFDISHGNTPSQKYFYLFGRNGIKAIPKSYDHNNNSRNRTIFRASYNFPIISNIYNSPSIAKAISIEELNVSLFNEWGALSESEKNIIENKYLKNVGLSCNINFAAAGSRGLSLNLIFAKPITGHNDHKENTFIWLGLNGFF